MRLPLFVLGTMLAHAANFPAPVEGDWVINHFQFTSGGVLPELRLHYRTVGSPSGEPVLVLHGSNSNGKRLLEDSFAGDLFGPDQPLDARRYYIILPDAIGHGGSSKPSDGLRGHFPHYTYKDMVHAQYRLVTEHLRVHHLRLIIGGSMGGMHTWMWGEMYPTFADALLPIACLPVEIAGLNRMFRRAIVDSIKTDPEWQGGEYTAPPVRGLTSAKYAALALSSNPLLTYRQAPTAARADQLLDEAIQGITKADANDLLYVVDASSDYNPEPHLGDIEARVIAINSADDPVNPPELGLMELKIKRVKRGTYILIPRSDETVGHETYLIAKFFKGYIAELLTAR